MNRLRIFVAGGIATVLMLGMVRPAQAADPVTFTEAQLTQTLFGAAVRVKDSGLDYEKNVIASAELLDWRAANPNATAEQVELHLGAIKTSLDENYRPTDPRRPGTEMRGRLLEILFATSGAVIIGPEVTRILAALTTRDRAPGVRELHIGQRLSGAQQQHATEVRTALAAEGVWTAVRGRAVIDPVIRESWRSRFGKPTAQHPSGLDPGWGLSELKQFDVLDELISVDMLVRAGRTGQEAFYDELRKQLTKLRDTLNTENDKVSAAIDELLRTAGVPGGPVVPVDFDKAMEREQAQRRVIDGIKGGLDFLVGLSMYVDKGFGKHVASFATTVYGIATAVNTIYTGIATLATTTVTGFSAFGVYGAIAGAAIGLIQIFAGLLSGGDPSLELQKKILSEIRLGFWRVHEHLNTIHSTMNKRFDRIDKSLNTIYKSMMESFGKVLAELEKVDRKLDVMYDALLTAISDMQGYFLQLVNGVQDHDKSAFLELADRYVDYSVKNSGRPLENFEGPISYLTGVSKFAFTGATTARNANFAFTGYGERNLDLALNGGPFWAVDYLAHRAREYGLLLPVSSPETMVPNANLWAQAARAYYITALQNPQHADTEFDREGADRAEQLIANGSTIRDAAQRFSAPAQNPESATNPLFKNLLDDPGIGHTALVRRFVEEQKSLQKDPAVMRSDRQFELFGWVDQPVDIGKIADPSFTSVSHCDDPSAPVLGRPDFLTGKNLPKPVLFGRYLDPEWAYSACWRNATWDVEPSNSILKTEWRGTGEERELVYTMGRLATFTIEHHESVRVPGSTSPTRVQIVTGRSSNTLCTWESHEVPDYNTPATCPARPAAPRVWDGGDLPRVIYHDRDALWPAAWKLMALARAKYYDLVASQFTQTGGLASAKDLKDNIRLLQAYTDLGFPRAKESDEQLRALVYGTSSLSNVAGMYREAAISLRAGKDPILDNPLIDQDDEEGCGNAGSITNPDPVAYCVQAQSILRKQRLASRFEIQSRNILANKSKETLPLVDEAIRNLELTSKHIRARQPAN